MNFLDNLPTLGDNLLGTFTILVTEVLGGSRNRGLPEIIGSFPEDPRGPMILAFPSHVAFPAKFRDFR